MKLKNVLLVFGLLILVPQLSSAMETGLTQREQLSNAIQRVEKEKRAAQAKFAGLEDKRARYRKILDKKFHQSFDELFKKLGTIQKQINDIEPLSGKAEVEKTPSDLKQEYGKILSGLNKLGITIAQSDNASDELGAIQQELEALQAIKKQPELLETHETPGPPEDDSPSTQRLSGPAASGLSPAAKAGIGAGIAALAVAGYLYKNAPAWQKDRIKGILHEYGKHLSNVSPAEQDLIVTASWARFNPAGAYFFKRAARAMPLDQDISAELWPVLYHLYYGKKKPSKRQKKELKQMYHEARKH